MPKALEELVESLIEHSPESCSRCATGRCSTCHTYSPESCCDGAFMAIQGKSISAAIRGSTRQSTVISAIKNVSKRAETNEWNANSLVDHVCQSIARVAASCCSGFCFGQKLAWPKGGLADSRATVHIRGGNTSSLCIRGGNTSSLYDRDQSREKPNTTIAGPEKTIEERKGQYQQIPKGSHEKEKETQCKISVGIISM